MGDGEKMRTEIHYFADDETEFDTEEECRAYEEEFKDLLSSVQFFDENFIQIRTVEDIEMNVVFMYIKDFLKAYDLFNRLCSWISFEVPYNVPYYNGDILWMNDTGEWINVGREINRLTAIRDTVLSGVE